MSHYYYFAATLPTLQLGAPAPLSSADFLERCARSIDGRELEALRSAVLLSPREGPPRVCRGVSRLLDGYYAWERSFRAALASLRAARLGKPSGAPVVAAPRAEDEAIASQARAALQASTPLEGELAVERARWAVIESLLNYDVFSFEAVAAYRLRLQALERLEGFGAERGERGYRAAYDAILGAANSIDLTGDLR